MPTPGERKALLFLAGVALLGAGVRVLRSSAPEPAGPPSAELDRQIAASDSAHRADRRSGPRGGRARRGPLRPDSSPRARRRTNGPPADTARFWVVPPPPAAAPALVDVDRATAEELETLPGIGPALAARIVRERQHGGPFGALGGLDRVPGVGPALLARVSARVTFSGSARPPTVAGVGASIPVPPVRRQSSPP